MTIDPITLALTGVLPFGVLLGALLAYPLARLLLRIYHRGVARTMGLQDATRSSPALVTPARAPAPPHGLQLLDVDDAVNVAPFTSEAAHVLNEPWRAAIAYAVAGSTFAAAMTAAWLVATHDPSLPATKLLLLFWTYFWPAVLTVNLVAGLRRHHWISLGAYFAVYALLTGVALVRNPSMGWHELPLYWLIVNGPPTLLLAAFLTRRIRAVGPMVLAFMVIGVTGSQIPATLLSNNEDLLRLVAHAGTAVGLSATAIFWGTMVVGLLAFGFAGWLALQWVGRRYMRKRLSDQMLTIDALWLVFGTVHSIGLVFEGWGWMFTGLAAFATFLAARSAAFAVLRRLPHPQPRRLLLLRVFALAARSERLFDVLQKHWRRAGDIMLIAGPDLVTTTVEPHEFLAFLGGGLSRQFVKDRADLAQRLERMDTGMDPDLRYRVNEFFCHADTWQSTMRELAARGDAVLMDLRSFSPKNQGCLFELGELLNSVDLRRVVFVIDATTDRQFLASSLGTLWGGVAEQSPNRTTSQPAARLYNLSRQPGERGLRGLFVALTS